MMAARGMLGFAMLCELLGTLGLRAASGSHWSWYLIVGPAYVASFWALSIALGWGLALGLAYGVWAACGVALTAVASRVLFGEALTLPMGLGIALVAVGVLLGEAGSSHQSAGVASSHACCFSEHEKRAS